MERRLIPTAAVGGVVPVRRLALVEPGPRLPDVLARLVALGDVTAVLVSRADAGPEAEAFRQALPTLPDDPDRLEREVLPGVTEMLLPGLRPGSAARIALGLDSGTVPRLTQAALWAGKRVVVTPNWPGTGTSGYRSVFAGHLDQLRSFGVVVLDAAAPTPLPGEPPIPPEVTYDQRLLTERDVFALLQRGVTRVAVPRGTLVTAQAVDTAREKGLQLLRR